MRRTNSLPGALPPREQELRQVFLRELQAVPGGDRLARCLQCGTCTGSCPVSYAMDLSPRAVIALFRAGMIGEILRSRTIWICASCYMCTSRCPQQIKITDLLYALKRVAMEKGLYPERFPVYVISRNFVRLLTRYGRNHEPLLVAMFYLRYKPLELLKLLPLGLAMYRKGRLAAMPRRIRGAAALRRMIEASESLELPRERAPVEYVPGTVGYRAVGTLPERAV
ncbi:MAG: 4Fe-4S dicluster domain-containing protein [Bryobacterales bacterium]|nr:4Fe-4S dicluster domain-containing protein [Bryobacterales bacterium]